MEEAKAQAKEKFGKEVSLREETDVLDTWFHQHYGHFQH